MSDTSPLAKLNRAEQLLAEASTITDILELRSVGKAAEAAAVALGFSEAAQHAKVFQLKAERKAGQYLADHVHPGRPGESSRNGRVFLGDLEIDHHQSSRWQTFARLSDEKFLGFIDDHLARGWEVTAGGMAAYAKNGAQQKVARPRRAGLLLWVPLGTCALYGYMIECSGGLEGHHLISKDMARGNDELRNLLRTCPPELMSQVCTAHNVGKLADSHNARRILLLQKVYEYGLVHVWQYINSLPWKVRMPEDRFEAMLEPKEVKT
jgi:hypothetical protein